MKRIATSPVGGGSEWTLDKQVRYHGAAFPALSGNYIAAVLPFAYHTFKYILFLSTVLLQACFF